jgi:hypothetical protein
LHKIITIIKAYILPDPIINVELEEAITYDFLWRYRTYRSFVLVDEGIHLTT